MTAAGYSVAAQMWGYVQMPAFAIAASMSAMAAQNIGAGQWDRVDRSRFAVLRSVLRLPLPWRFSSTL